MVERDDSTDSGYDMSSRLSAAIPYKWEAAPGKPISEAAPASSEPCRTPLRPPPGSSGVHRPVSFVEPTFDGFEPEAEVLKPSGQHLAEKIFKKLMKLRKKSMVAAACFSLDNFRDLTEHSRRFAIEDAERCYDSDEHSGCAASAFDQPDTPSSTSSLGSSSSESVSTTSGYATPSSAPHQPGSQLMANMLLSLSPSDDDECKSDDYGSEEGEPLNGPRECAWHQPEDEDLTEQEWQMVRYGHLRGRSSALISTLARQGSRSSASDHSYKYLTIGGASRRSSMLPRLDEGMKHLGLEKS